MPRSIQLPGRAELGQGARAEFALAFQDLWKAAGRPTVRSVEDAVRSADLAGAMSRELFRKTLLGTAVPTPWLNVEAAVDVLAVMARFDDAGCADARVRLLRLWNAALDSPQRSVEPRGSDDPVPEPRAATTPLTARENEVLRLVAAGESTEEIAGRLFLSTGTVRNYVTAAISKLAARNRLDAIRIARDRGWLDA